MVGAGVQGFAVCGRSVIGGDHVTGLAVCTGACVAGLAVTGACVAGGGAPLLAVILMSAIYKRFLWSTTKTSGFSWKLSPAVSFDSKSKTKRLFVQFFF